MERICGCTFSHPTLFRRGDSFAVCKKYVDEADNFLEAHMETERESGRMQGSFVSKL